MAQIFISYKRDDKEKVFKIRDKIEAAVPVKCWIDLDGIASSAVFASEIISAINDCEVFLFMYSKQHTKITDFENDWTIRELSFAQSKKKRIVFINIDGTELTDWFELYFGTKQQVNGKSEEALRALTTDLTRWLDLTPVPPPPPQPPLPYFEKLVKYSIWAQTALLVALIAVFLYSLFWGTISHSTHLRTADAILILTLAGMIWSTWTIKKYKFCKWSFLLWDVLAIALLLYLTTRYNGINRAHSYTKGNFIYSNLHYFVYSNLRYLGYYCRTNVPLIAGVFSTLYVVHNLCIHAVMNSRTLWNRFRR